MSQIHKRLTGDQTKLILSLYDQGHLSKEEVLSRLEVKERRFYLLLKAYRAMQAWYAMSPEAKGKIERPYRWLQDRIVRRCAKAGIADIGGARDILADELDRYNNRQVHSTTGEIPRVRFEKAVSEGRTVFHPLRLKPPITSTKDIFCLRETRVVDGYGRISYKGHLLETPKDIPTNTRVELHIIPEPPAPEIRLWYKNKLRRSYRIQP